ncbi:MAG: class I SAM-dependent methyltransferase [Endozoicomonas sp.]
MNPIEPTELTHNGRGVTFTVPHPLLDDWLRGWKGEEPLLDLGCAFGAQTIRALASGARVIAMDMTESHLQVLHERLPVACKSRCQTLIGELPGPLPLADNSVSGILCGDVLHFLQGVDIKRALGEMYRILLPGGVVALTMASIRMKILESSHFRAEVEARWRQRPDEFNGHFDQLPHICIEKARELGQFEVAEKYEEMLKERDTPFWMNLFIDEQLQSQLETLGFRVLNCEYGPNDLYITPIHGPEDQLRVVAVK